VRQVHFFDLTSSPEIHLYPHGISLQHLVLTSNVIETIPFPNEQQQISLSSIQYLSLSENRIASWPSFDALSIWMPNLKSLSIRGNPLLNGIWLHHHTSSCPECEPTTICYRKRRKTSPFFYYRTDLVPRDIRRHQGTSACLFHSITMILVASQISSRERTDSELYYMSFIIQQGHRSEDKRREEHRRWAELCDSQLLVDAN
jgi:hypothetical protein